MKKLSVLLLLCIANNALSMRHLLGQLITTAQAAEEASGDNNQEDQSKQDPTISLVKACKIKATPQLIANLIARGAQVDAVVDGTTALLAAVDNPDAEHSDFIQMLASHASKENKKHALERAVAQQKWHTMEKLQAMGAQTNDDPLDRAIDRAAAWLAQAVSISSQSLHTLGNAMQAVPHGALNIFNEQDDDDDDNDANYQAMYHGIRSNC